MGLDNRDTPLGKPWAPEDWAMEMSRQCDQHVAAISLNGRPICRPSLCHCGQDECAILTALQERARRWIAVYLLSGMLSSTESWSFNRICRAKLTRVLDCRTEYLRRKTGHHHRHDWRGHPPRLSLAATQLTSDLASRVPAIVRVIRMHRAADRVCVAVYRAQLGGGSVGFSASDPRCRRADWRGQLQSLCYEGVDATPCSGRF